MQVSEYLKKGWCQKAFARDEFGSSVAAFDPRAVSWCYEGAIIGASSAYDSFMGETMQVLQEWGFEPNAIRFNDQAESSGPLIKLAEEVERRLGLDI